MKWKIMDREKFDEILQGKVQKFEQEYSPVFNQQRIWNGIKKNDTRRSWFVIASASVIVIIGLSILFQQYNRPVEVVKLRKSPVKSGKSSQISVAERHSMEMANNKPEKQIVEGPNLNHKSPEVLNNSNQPMAAIAISDNEPQRTDSNQTQVVQMIEPVTVKTIQVPADAKDSQAEIKVFFKRGSSVNDMPTAENKLVFKKFKLRIFENQTYDTSAYASGAEVEADRKFRIKF